MDEDEAEFFDEEDYEAPILPAGFTLAAFLWNMLTLFAAIFDAFAQLCRGFRADVCAANEAKQLKKSFTSSVEAGIESLG